MVWINYHFDDYVFKNQLQDFSPLFLNSSRNNYKRANWLFNSLCSLFVFNETEDIMRKRRTEFLNEYVANQYPIEKFKELIFITLDIVENFLLTLENGYNYNSTSIASYEEKYGSSQRNTNSKIESIIIKNMRDEEKMSQFLNCYFIAYNTLNKDEKDIFDATFIDRLTDQEIIDKYKTYSKHITQVKKSAVIKFCLRSGLDKFVDVIK